MLHLIYKNFFLPIYKFCGVRVFWPESSHFDKNLDKASRSVMSVLKMTSISSQTDKDSGQNILTIEKMSSHF